VWLGRCKELQYEKIGIIIGMWQIIFVELWCSGVEAYKYSMMMMIILRIVFQ